MKTFIAILVSLVPSVAHAEFLAPSHKEVRAQAVEKNAKSDHTPSRASLRAPVVEAPAPAARGLELDDVIGKVNGVYMAGLQRCYRKSLATDPMISGKLDLQIKVAADGRVSSGMQGDGIERCLSNLMTGWRFGIALDDNGVATEASFKIALMLR